MSIFKAIGRLFEEQKSKQAKPVKVKALNMAKLTSIDNKANIDASQVSKVNESLVIELKEYRVSVARREGIKPYMVLTDWQLNAIIEAKPISVRELSWIEGIDEERAIKYGKGISEIFRYR